MQKERVLVTGASGFIGSNLLDYLLEKDYEVIGLSRQKNPSKIHPHLTWIQALEELKHDRIDYVVNLAGESIAQGRWTDVRKQKLIASRVDMTTMLYQYLAKRKIQPKCIISGSAVGYYGIDPTEQWTERCTEQSPPQSIFMSELCQKWEQSARQDTMQNTKIIRLGVVFGRGAGILSQMLFPIKMNLCARIGSGRQPVVWVHIQDVLRAIEFLMLHETTEKVFNVVSPEKVTQSAFAQTAAQILKRKPLLSLPAFVLKLLLGEQSQLVLNGQFVRPEALKAQGFDFKYPTLKEALIQIIQPQNLST
ncbi:TIGR01777 family protein [Acinetobacter sp. WCHA55]|uniref:TIGR01777 family oxidoreductase n=1 Tax=Acinetobacter sp. WCHA55 TaxID=2004646 RepID=UPI000B3C5956|nr:TIGR01777 family oxidoreductase [Acinetobacter sp. WCHA55]AYA69647.1 TIGR01777 family protein [Acinetobacter sp. WCHA55]